MGRSAQHHGGVGKCSGGFARGGTLDVADGDEA